MVNTPIPHSLKSEAKKAAKILREFSMPNAKTGIDKLIPAGILAKARGLAILTVFKAGFLVTARGGSGIVIAKLDDSLDFSTGWSAPSAIALAGLGGGFEIGMEVTDFVIILNTRSAVDAFSKGGNLTLGGNFTIAAGPLGRNVEGDIAVRSPATIYTYSKTKGIFAGISIEGSALIERKEANRKFYGKDLRAHQILNGEVSPPESCHFLYDVMREHQEMAARALLQMGKKQALKHRDEGEQRFRDYTSSRFGSSADGWHTRSTKSRSSHSSHSSNSSMPRSQSEWTLSKKSTSITTIKSSSKSRPSSSSSKGTTSTSWSKPSMTGSSSHKDVWADSDDEEHFVWAITDFPFKAQLSCDLTFDAGEKIRVTTQTETQDDWWEGIDAEGKQGIFPANFVHIVTLR